MRSAAIDPSVAFLSLLSRPRISSVIGSTPATLRRPAQHCRNCRCASRRASMSTPAAESQLNDVMVPRRNRPGARRDQLFSWATPDAVDSSAPFGAQEFIESHIRACSLLHAMLARNMLRVTCMRWAPQGGTLRTCRQCAASQRAWKGCCGCLSTFGTRGRIALRARPRCARSWQNA